MKTLKKYLLMSLAIISLTAHSAGMITHNVFAQKSLSDNTSTDVLTIINNHYDDFITGSDYPDTGYLKGATYGEDSHWAPFMNATMRHINANGGIEKNQRLMAFLFGIHSHNISDIIWHWGFITESSRCSGLDWMKVHALADWEMEFCTASKFYDTLPAFPKWSLPIDDLVAIYARMGKPYSAEEIIRANTLYYLARMGENIIMRSPRLRAKFIERAQKIFPSCGYATYPTWMSFTYEEVERHREVLWNAFLTGDDIADYPKPYPLAKEKQLRHFENEIPFKFKIPKYMIEWVKVDKVEHWYQFDFKKGKAEKFEKFIASLIDEESP